jgi:hypothetical protein
MAFDVYPDGQAAPLIVTAGGSSAVITITERIGLDPVTGQNLMLIRTRSCGLRPTTYIWSKLRPRSPVRAGRSSS